MKKQQYYKVPYTETPAIKSFDQAKSLVRDGLIHSVRRRLVSDVPLGTFLSGGIDSTLVTGIAAREVKDLKSFSIGFKDSRFFDESDYARLASKHFQTDHQLFNVKGKDLFNEVMAVVDALDEPFADSSALPMHLLCRLTRKEVKVALSGEGADEIFSGYNKHLAWVMADQHHPVVAVANRLGWFWRLFPKSRHSRVSNKMRQLEKLSALGDLAPRDRYWKLASFMNDEEVRSLIAPGRFADLSSIKEPILEQIIKGELNEVLKLDTQMVLPGDMLQKVDLMSMASGLEVRVPFLDHELVKVAFNLPESFKVKGMTGKYILREAFKDLLPPDIYQRKKHGFDVPLLFWFRREMKSDLDQWIFNRDRIESQGLFNWQEITRIKTLLNSSNPGDVHIKIWSLYVFQRWFDTYCSMG